MIKLRDFIFMMLNERVKVCVYDEKVLTTEISDYIKSSPYKENCEGFIERFDADCSPLFSLYLQNSSVIPGAYLSEAYSNSYVKEFCILDDGIIVFVRNGGDEDGSSEED